MPRYTARLIAESLVRLGQRAYYEKFETTSNIFEFSDGKVVFFDQLITPKLLHLPNGLIVQAEVESPDISQAVEQIQSVAGNLLGVFSIAAQASIGTPRPLWVYDSTPAADPRELMLFNYDPILTLKTRGNSEGRVEEVWNAITKGWMQDPNVEKDDKARLAWALTSYRRALADNDDLLTEFLIHWTAAETIDKIYRQRVLKGGWHGKKAETLNGIEDAFERLGERRRFSRCRNLRSDIAHGLRPLDEVIREARENIELVRRVATLMTMAVLGVSQDTQDQILQQQAFKGRYPPHLRMRFSGSFTPGDVGELGEHPQLEPAMVELEEEASGESISLTPKWNYKFTSEGKLEFYGVEAWGEGAAQMKIEVGQPTVIKGSGTVEAEPTA
ncbi:MAG: hypothetical protein DLM58_01390 [Pseudonocardiales bacterium]|nr:MAG: hypothetical protein DLM58_01390 [Pseudonocardiales bacterium]